LLPILPKSPWTVNLELIPRNQILLCRALRFVSYRGIVNSMVDNVFIPSSDSFLFIFLSEFEFDADADVV
jgi:hypothetical protein